MVELPRQRRALDLSNLVAQQSAAVERYGLVAVTVRIDRSRHRRPPRPAADQAEAKPSRVALQRLACLAPLARVAMHDLRADVDIQRLALDGRRPTVFERTAHRSGTEHD